MTRINIASAGGGGKVQGIPCRKKIYGSGGGGGVVVSSKEISVAVARISLFHSSVGGGCGNAATTSRGSHRISCFFTKGIPCLCLGLDLMLF
jgi:hypothetical protein